MTGVLLRRGTRADSRRETRHSCEPPSTRECPYGSVWRCLLCGNRWIRKVDMDGHKVWKRRMLPWPQKQPHA